MVFFRELYLYFFIADIMKTYHIKAQNFLSEDSILERTLDFKTYFDKIPCEGLKPVQHEEKAFPLAFVHLIHSEVGIFEMFLAVMYRPEDFHCVQIDAKVNIAKKLLLRLPQNH